MENPGKTDHLKRVCRAPWASYVPPFPMGPRVWYVSGNDWVASYLVDTGDGLALIDTAMHESLYLLLENVRLLGYDPRDIRLILLSHAHIDHIGGARALKELTGARIGLGEGDHPFLHERRDLVMGDGYTWGTFEPDLVYADDRPVTLGAVTFHTVATPGHTPGCTSFRFDVEDERGRKLCMAMHGGLGLNTLGIDHLTRNGLPLHLRDDFLAGLAELDTWHVDITLPSHTNQVEILPLRDRITSTHNPYLDPDAWHTMLQKRMRMARESFAAERSGS